MKLLMVDAIEWYRALPDQIKKETVTMFMDRLVLWYDISDEEIYSLYYKVMSYN